MSPLFTVIVFTEISVYKLGMGISFSISEEWQYEIELLKIKTSVGNRKKQKKKQLSQNIASTETQDTREVSTLQHQSQTFQEQELANVIERNRLEVALRPST